jgi:hypothetical protein
VHVGGEILDCDSVLAAAMLLPPQEAQAVLAHLDTRPEARRAWARQALAMPDFAPYVAARAIVPHAAALICNAVGGADLERADAALREEVRAKLAGADAVTVRDAQTAAALAGLGIASRLLPDSVCMLRELFGAQLKRRAATGEVARLASRFPEGYLAVQFSADFGDDATLAAIAAGLDALARSRRLGIVFFRAGAALWHDELSVLQRAKARMKTPAAVFDSIDIWDSCALISTARGYLGSSLHGRIIAMAHGLPRANLLLPGAQSAKHGAYAAAWEADGLPTLLSVDDLACGMEAALAAAPEILRALAREHEAIYRRGFEEWHAMLG